MRVEPVALNGSNEMELAFVKQKFPSSCAVIEIFPQLHFKTYEPGKKSGFLDLISYLQTKCDVSVSNTNPDLFEQERVFIELGSIEDMEILLRLWDVKKTSAPYIKGYTLGQYYGDNRNLKALPLMDQIKELASPNCMTCSGTAIIGTAFEGKVLRLLCDCIPDVELLALLEGYDEAQKKQKRVT